MKSFVFSGRQGAGGCSLPNALTVDVEDYYQVSAFESRICPTDWEKFPVRVVENTERILALFRRRQVRGTFFILGWVAEKYPELVRRIRDEGHEIGAHSFWHRRIDRQSPEAFRQELCRTKELLSRLAGGEIVSYRAPSFSITRASWWALPILAEEGFWYDSSVFPIRHDRYGVPEAPVGIYRVWTSGGAIWEFPPAVYRVGGMGIPCGGGGYFRLYPLGLTLWLLRAIRREGRPFVFYVHPWELDPRQPRLAGSWLSRFRHYWNLAGTARRLEVVLDEFSFAPVCEVMEAYLRQAESSLPDPSVRATDAPKGVARPTSFPFPLEHERSSSLGERSFPPGPESSPSLGERKGNFESEA